MNTKINVLDIAKRRYTTKHYDPTRHVSSDDLKQLLGVIQYSPSSVNVQPWHVVVVNNQTAGADLLPAVADFNHARIVDSSYTLVFCIRSELTPEYLEQLLDKERADGRLPTAEIETMQKEGRRYFVGLNSQTLESQQEWSKRQLYIALGQFLFAAAALDLDTTAIEGFDPEAMDRILDLKAQGFQSVVLATLGYHANDDHNATRPKSRLMQNELFTQIERAIK